MHAHGVARLEPRYLAQLTALDVLDDRAHVERWPEAARNGSGIDHLADRHAPGRPVGGEDLADQVSVRHRPPRPRVAGGDAVVTHHEVLLLAEPHRRDRARVTPLGADVGLVESLAVDVDIAAALLPEVARQAD